ncbi:carbamoyltransferase C-terminal domain-containing protein [Algoriphagus boritolerans]|uniref:carbamoyltransferase C-terminal domain-containing protein n=1 Tax=Algoriphagus boritolerans TaxID=308111 RepID=UPI002FCE5766
MAGGVALNCVANGKLQEAGIFDEIYIQPAAGDAGGALGAALAAYHLYFSKEERKVTRPDSMEGSYLGPSYSDKEVLQVIRKVKAVYHHFTDLNKMNELVAGELAKGQVVGWFQGRMEFGPRALGNRSILGDARNPEMQKKAQFKNQIPRGIPAFCPVRFGGGSRQLF